jgi:rhodanese-related sulfurtransferase
MTQFLIFAGQEWQLVLALLVLAGVFFWNEGRRAGATISVHQLTTQVNSANALVLDLREQKEFREGHIVGSINIPFAKLAERMGELQPHKERPLILVDKMGQHSATSGRLLLQAGYNALRLQGGISEWTTNNLPVVKGN